MSYSGTVRCSWCGKQGHNRSGCPDRKLWIAENPDSYEARQQERRASRAKAKKCSYCKETGHNRRKCEVLANDRQILKEHLTKQRKKASDVLAARGLGVGAMVRIRDYWLGQMECLVTRIEWKSLDDAHHVSMLFESIRNYNGRDSTFARRVDISRTPEFSDTPEDHLDDTNVVRVISPICEDLVLCTAPSDWAAGTNYDEERYFPKGEARKRWEWDRRLQGLYE